MQNPYFRSIGVTLMLFAFLAFISLDQKCPISDNIYNLSNTYKLNSIAENSLKESSGEPRLIYELYDFVASPEEIFKRETTIEPPDPPPTPGPGN